MEDNTHMLVVYENERKKKKKESSRFIGSLKHNYPIR